MKNKKWIVPILGVLCTILVVAVVITVTSGKKKGTKADTSEAETSAKTDTQDDYIINFEGKKYKKNRDLKTVLFMGVDKEASAQIGQDLGDAGQSDSLNLIILNKKTKKAQIMQISRDSMTSIDIYDSSREKMASKDGQIALQYSFGGGGKQSCRLTAEKVSELLFKTDIESYISLTMDGIGVAADAIGGITLTVPEDYTWIDPEFQVGKEVTLKGEKALMYVRKRDVEELKSNNQRMERQSQFMKALITQMNADDIGTREYASIYTQLEPYMVTNMTADAMKDLAEYEYDADMITVPGSIVESDGHAQYIVDKEELKKIIVKTFYKTF